MANANDKAALLRQNLIDAGLDGGLAENCNTSELLPVLQKQRSELLRELHKKQKQIDCLDFLVYQINNNKF